MLWINGLSPCEKPLIGVLITVHGVVHHQYSEQRGSEKGLVTVAGSTKSRQPGDVKM